MTTYTQSFTKLYGSIFKAILLGTLLLTYTGKNPAQEKSFAGDMEVRQRVADIINGAIKRSEFVLEDGTKISQRALPSDEEAQEVKQFGDKAVPILAEYLNSQNSAQKTLAMRLLGYIGSESIVKPLENVATKDPSPDVRILALTWLTQAPWEKAYPVIRKASEADRSKQVRRRASELLIQYTPK